MRAAPRLVGRDADCARVRELMARGGLVTVTGPGGVGKSRLVDEIVEGGQLEAATALLARVPPDGDEQAVARALGFESTDSAVMALTERPTTVVLDNCEHVAGAVRRFVQKVRAAVPTVLVLTTTREPLGLPGEQVYVLAPLGVPAAGGIDTQPAPSVELFLQRAAEAGAALGADTRALADVEELCRRLDGLPLAIELAAARSRGLSPSDLLAVVDSRLDLLRRASGSGDRHDSMRAAIEVSTDLLTAAERRCFRRLGVFTGPFDAALAHAVTAEPGSELLTTVDLLAVLVDRSLVVAETIAGGNAFRLLELLREHAHDELVAAHELVATEERFVDAMVDTADRIVAQALGNWQPGLLATASTQFANLVRACEVCLERDSDPDRAYRLVLPMFAAVHEGRSTEVFVLGRRVLTRWPGTGALWRAEVLAVLATAAAIGGFLDEVAPMASAVVDDPASSTVARALADRAWGLADRPSDPLAAAQHFGLARAAATDAGFGSIAREAAAFEAGEVDLAGDRVGALELLDTTLRAAVEADDVFVTVLAQLVRARVRLRAGDVDGARADVTAAREASDRMGQPWWSAALLRTEAAVASFDRGGWDAAAHRWRAAVDHAASRGALGELAITLRAAAATARRLGHDEAAATLQAAVPRSSAITVMPELFPAEAAELAAAPAAPPSGSGLVEALGRAREVLGGAEAPAHVPPPTPAEVNELVAEGDSWRFTYRGTTVRVRDLKGVLDLAVLLARPGTEVHALELMGGQDVGSAAGPHLDDRARRAYQERIVGLQRDIDEARADHDPARAEKAEVELDALVHQLSEAFGIGGRARATGSSAERARSAVTYRIRAAIRRLGELHPELGRHLANAVRTGTWCSYRPESEVVWTVERPGLTL